MLFFDTDWMWSFLAAGVHIGKVMVDTSAAPKKQHTDNCLGPKRAPAPFTERPRGGAQPGPPQAGACTLLQVTLPTSVFCTAPLQRS